MPSLMQQLMNYPVSDAGWMMAPRGFGTMLAMFLVARIIDRSTPPVHPGRVPDDRGVAVADERVFVPIAAAADD